MTEPKQIDLTINNNIPEKLEKALLALADYHQAIIQRNTLKTQDPNVLEEIAIILRQKSKAIHEYLQTSQLPEELSSDTELKSCLEHLKQTNIPYSAYINTMICYWTKLMFEDYPFSISHNHIGQLYQNSISGLEDDESQD
jgi:hypothetical protein